jgi:hypothetical protein
MPLLSDIFITFLSLTIGNDSLLSPFGELCDEQLAHHLVQ